VCTYNNNDGDNNNYDGGTKNVLFLFYFILFSKEFDRVMQERYDIKKPLHNNDCMLSLILCL